MGTGAASEHTYSEVLCISLALPVSLWGLFCYWICTQIIFILVITKPKGVSGLSPASEVLAFHNTRSSACQPAAQLWPDVCSLFIGVAEALT